MEFDGRQRLRSMGEPPFPMGLEIEQERFDERDVARFSKRLREGLDVLERLLAIPGFGVAPRSLGAELELFLVGPDGQPRPVNRRVLADTLDPRVKLELNRFNLELNTRPTLLSGNPFTALEAELEDGLAAIACAAQAHDARPVTIGILPTLSAAHLTPEAMSDVPRFRALSAGLRRLRQEPFQIRIDGDEPLELCCDDVTLEGANSALQIHLRVAPSDFASVYNAAQLATGPALAASGNSPVFLGHRLWEETRVALFKQSVDARNQRQRHLGQPARVVFGHGWVRRGAHEVFAESVALHPPLLPVTSEEAPSEVLRSGRVPALHELRLHHSTVWRWNRSVYDPAEGGHLRIEMRALPAGPTVRDMLANAAFLVGLTLGLAPRAERWIVSLPFEHAERNFYRAAREGLEAELLWPSEEAPSPRPVRAADLILKSIPIAQRGLDEAGVARSESGPLLECIAARVAAGRTGSRWQREQLARLDGPRIRKRALHELLDAYLTRAGEGRPVDRWAVEG